MDVKPQHVEVPNSGGGGCFGCMIVILALMFFVAGVGLMCKAIHRCWT